MNERIILYGSYTCPMVAPVRDILKRANAEFEYINISTDAEGRQRVREINQGYESVPTLVFPDGSTLTEPRMSELEAKLSVLGYEIAPNTIAGRARGIAQNPMLLIIGLMTLAWGAAGGGAGLILFGGGVLAIHLLARFLA
ncbi:MAG: glutathione S-transferase N-terminal domain-containing protein [Caldilineales bacterium]|nr:glutathione S-transferase N-terminal domain-containing protein [Caldilineales bacterium]